MQEELKGVHLMDSRKEARKQEELKVVHLKDSRPFPFNYVRGMSTGGIFSYSGGGAYYFPLDAVDRELKISIGRHINAIFCSTAGLLLCQHRRNDVTGRPIYAVLNPFIPRSERTIESPRLRHPVGTARALVVHRGDQHARSYVFRIVCAVPAEINDGRYTFEEYSSNTGQWHYPATVRNDLGRIRANSGVSCGRKAYWLTEMRSSIVCYNVENKKTHVFPVPDYPKIENQIVQLGVRRDSSGPGRKELLILIVPTQAEVKVYTRRRRQNIWTLDFHMQLPALVSCQLPMIPLRSQSRKFEVLLCYEQRLHIWVKAWGGGQDDRIFPLQFQPLQVLDSADDFVPHVVDLELNPLALDDYRVRESSITLPFFKFLILIHVHFLVDHHCVFAILD